MHEVTRITHQLNLSAGKLYVTWSRGMSRMSGILILSYRLQQLINSYVLHCFWIWRIVHISATRCPIEMGFGSKCSILNGQVICIEKSKLNIADMWLIPLDRVTYMFFLSSYKVLSSLLLYFSWWIPSVKSWCHQVPDNLPSGATPRNHQRSSALPNSLAEVREHGGTHVRSTCYWEDIYSETAKWTSCVSTLGLL